MPDITPNPFPEPVASREMYEAHIYGTVEVKNGETRVRTLEGGGGAVTVLAARRKKRKCDSVLP